MGVACEHFTTTQKNWKVLLRRTVSEIPAQLAALHRIGGWMNDKKTIQFYFDPGRRLEVSSCLNGVLPFHRCQALPFI